MNTSRRDDCILYRYGYLTVDFDGKQMWKYHTQNQLDLEN